MKIFLTGGSGFIGKNLIEQLGSKYKISAPDHKRLDLLQKAKVKKYLKSHRFDLVIHSANIGNYEDNMKMFYNLFYQCKCRMICYGSGAEHNREGWKLNMTENDIKKSYPIDEYGRSKAVINSIIQFGGVNLRLFGVYGKYDKSNRFIPYVIRRARNRQPIIIRQNSKMDYLYVGDLARITEYFINQRGTYPDYNVCTGKAFKLTTIAKKILKVLKVDVPIIVKEKTGENYSGNNHRLLEEIGDFKFTDIEDLSWEDLCME